MNNPTFLRGTILSLLYLLVLTCPANGKGTFLYPTDGNSPSPTSNSVIEWELNQFEEQVWNFMTNPVCNFSL